MPTIRLNAKDCNPGIVTDYLMMVNAVTGAIARGHGHMPNIAIAQGTLYVGFICSDMLQPGFVQVMVRGTNTIIHISTADTHHAKIISDALIERLEIKTPQFDLI